jgi:hypothetical protein
MKTAIPSKIIAGLKTEDEKRAPPIIDEIRNEIYVSSKGINPYSTVNERNPKDKMYCF